MFLGYQNSLKPFLKTTEFKIQNVFYAIIIN